MTVQEFMWYVAEDVGMYSDEYGDLLTGATWDVRGASATVTLESGEVFVIVVQKASDGS